jgi:nucleoside-diphosphate-sugar epimerase
VASRSDARRVLVTGCSGFTGNYVRTRLVELGWTVVDPEADGRQFDLAKPETVAPAVASANPDCVIHLAARSFVGSSDAVGFYRVNAVGTVNLLEALVRSGLPLQRVILASSANVYGNATVDVIGEETAPAPVNHYAVSKLAMEHLAATYADRLPLVIVRPFNYTGVGQPAHFVVPKLVAHFAERQPSVRVGNIDVIRDFSDVRAVAEVYVRLLTAEACPKLLNICSGVGLSLRRIIDDLAELSGHSIEIRVDPDLVRASEVHRLVGSPDALHRTVGSLPHRDFRETLAWMLASAEAAR